MKPMFVFFLLLGLTAVHASAGNAPLMLVDFNDPAVMDRMATLDSEIERAAKGEGHVLKVEMGTEKPYPNARIQAPEGGWDLSKFTKIEAEITNMDDETISVACRVDNPGATGKKNSCTGGVTLDPGQTGTLTVHFNRTFREELKAQLEGMHHTPWGKREPWGGSIDPANIVELNFFMNKPSRPHTFLVDHVRATGTFDPASMQVPEPFFPFIDKYGQYIHDGWPNKIEGPEDFDRIREAEQKAIDSKPAPATWDTYGGWSNGPEFEATGHFYPKKYQGKWYLVNPIGHLFFALGMDCVRHGGGTPVNQGRDHWFKNAPWEKEPDMAQFLDKDAKAWRGEYKGKPLHAFLFNSANLKRKYGEDWEQTWYTFTPRRLQNWGFNIIGNWSDDKLFATTSIPYTHWVFINPKKLPWQPGSRNRISDPFDPGFEKELRRRATGMIGSTVDDPYCIGYYVDNELSWGADDTHLAQGVVEQGDRSLAASQKFLEILQLRYQDIADFNAAWGVNLASWDAWHDLKRAPTTEQGESDLRTFNQLIARTYFRTVRDVLKDIAPNKLYLGSRFCRSDQPAQAVAAAAEFCDVVSFNIYSTSLGAWKPPVDIDRPVIIGEFHFGARDSGVFGPGLVGAENQQDRADKFSTYVETALHNPLVVGVNWFQFVDQPATGRTGEGENHNIGFLSITDTPYELMTDASRKVAGRMYHIRSQGTR